MLLEWHYLGDEPIVAIAARWNRSPSAVYGRLARATQQLTERLVEEGLLDER